MSESTPGDLLRQAARALKDVGKAALVVKPTLTKPYPDAPRTNPWQQFMDQPAREAYNLGVEILRLIGSAPDVIETDEHPFGLPPTGWRAAPDCALCKDLGRATVHNVDAHCQCKRGRRMSELWFADKHGLHHADMPEPEPPDEHELQGDEA